MEDGFMILLHAFMKTTRTTPKTELDLARARLKAYKSARKEAEGER